MDNEFMIDYKKQNKRGKALIIIFLVVLFLLGLYFGGNFLIKKFDSKLIFVNFFDDIFEKIDNSIYSYNDKFKDSNIQIENNFDLSFDIGEELDFTSIGLDTILQFDRKNNNLFMDYKYLENKETLANFQLLYDNQNFYFSFNELFDKVLKISSLTEEEKNEFNELVEQLNENIEFDSKDIKNFLKLTKQIIINNIEEDKFIRSKENVSIEGVNYKLDKHAYVFEGNEYQEFIVNILNDIRNNDEYINLLVKVFGLSKEDFVIELDELIEEEKNIVVNSKIEYVIYTKGLFREVVGLGIIFMDNDTKDGFKVKYFNVDDKYLFLVDEEYEDDNIDNYYHEIVGKKQDDIIKLRYELNDELISNIIYKSIGDSIELVFSEPTDEYSLKIRFSSLSEDNLLTFNFSIEYIYDEINMILGVNSKIRPIDEILEFDYENSVDIDNLTDEDILKIQDNMMRIFEDSKLFNNLFGYSDQFDESLITF